jgi:hypothetical protein
VRSGPEWPNGGKPRRHRTLPSRHHEALLADLQIALLVTGGVGGGGGVVRVVVGGDDGSRSMVGEAVRGEVERGGACAKRKLLGHVTP